MNWSVSACPCVHVYACVFVCLTDCVCSYIPALLSACLDARGRLQCFRCWPPGLTVSSLLSDVMSPCALFCMVAVLCSIHVFPPPLFLLSQLHGGCRENYPRKCPLGQCRLSILPPTAISSIDSDGYWEGTRPPGTSPLLVYVNTKSGDNQVP